MLIRIDYTYVQSSCFFKINRIQQYHNTCIDMVKHIMIPFRDFELHLLSIKFDQFINFIDACITFIFDFDIILVMWGIVYLYTKSSFRVKDFWSAALNRNTPCLTGL